MRPSCQQMQEQLLDMVGSSLPLEEMGALREHVDSCPACRAYWAALRADDARLRDCVGALQPAVARIEDGVLRQLAYLEPLPRSRPAVLRLPFLRRRPTGMTVAAVLALGLLLLFGRGRTTLYDQVMGTLEEVRTLHVVDATLRDGRWQKGAEVWYDHNAGVAATIWRGGQVTFQRIDNGEHVWMYAAGSDLGRRSRSVGALRVVADLLQTGMFTRDSIRVPDEDRLVGGGRWQAYLAANGTDTIRFVAWLDGDRRVRAWEKRRLSREDLWETYRMGTVEYDGKLDPALFKPDFGPGVKIVEVETLLDELFGLDQALVTKEVLGFIFAVHEVRRCEGNMPYVVCSLRPTEETKRQIAYQGPSAWNYGSFSLGASWHQADANGSPERYYQVLRLGHIYHEGLEVQSAFLVPMGSWPEQVTDCELEVYVSTNNEAWRRKRTVQGWESEGNFKALAVVPLPEAESTPVQVVSDVYTLARRVEPFVAFNRLVTKPVPFTDEEMEDYIRAHPDSDETRDYRAGDTARRLARGSSKGVGQIGREDWMEDRLQWLTGIVNQRN